MAECSTVRAWYWMRDSFASRGGVTLLSSHQDKGDEEKKEKKEKKEKNDKKDKKDDKKEKKAKKDK